MITVVSIAFGLACVIFFISLNEGVYAQLVDDAVRMQAGHVTIEHAEYREAPAIDLTVRGATALAEQIAAGGGRGVKGLEGVETVKLLTVGQGVARSGAGAVGVALIGVQPSIEILTSPLARKIVEGAYLDDTDDARVVIGRTLADHLDLEIGKKLVIATNDASGEIVEALFRVKGIFATGAEEIDGYLVQAPLAPTQRLFGLAADEVTQIGVVLDDPDRQQRVIETIAALVADRSMVGDRVPPDDSAPAAVLPWQEVSPELSAFIHFDRISDRFFLGLLLVLILFTIFNTVLMSVLEREQETAVMMALGTARRDVALQILMESAYIGLLGCALGIAFGAGTGLYVQTYGWDLSSMYEEGLTVSGTAMSTILHAKVTVELTLGLAAIVFGATLLLTLGPARRAAGVPIADVLRG
ncbi:MAG: FtsX-like permease family protein [Candidatus Binatia bacterium]